MSLFETFSDFIRDRDDIEHQGLVDRIYKFLSNNSQFSYDSGSNLPGLVPLERIAQEIVVQEPKLRRFFRASKYDGAKLVKVRSDVWDGDVIAFFATASGSRYQTFNNFRGRGYDFDYDRYRDPYLDGYRRRSRRRDYYDRDVRPTPGSPKYSRANESLFSDFMNSLRSVGSKAQMYDANEVLGRMLYFLKLNPEFDYHELSDTPGLIFVTLLSQYTKVPHKVLVDFFNRTPLPNSTVIDFKVSDLRGPVIVFNRPQTSREEAWAMWSGEGQDIDTDDIIDRDPDTKSGPTVSTSYSQSQPSQGSKPEITEDVLVTETDK